MIHTSGTARIDAKFASLRAAGQSGLAAFVTASDPNFDISLAVCQALTTSGADLIELGMPFSDPMADGPAIQQGNLRALKSGATLSTTLSLLRAFRKKDQNTPVVMMGYYNPIYIYGVQKFLTEAADAGCDGLIVVDLPPEEDSELCLPTIQKSMSFIRLATPTTSQARLPVVLENTSGFLYYVSMTGITGVGAPQLSNVEASVKQIRKFTNLPIAVGFGIRSAEQAKEVAKFADATVVGSAFVECIGNTWSNHGDIPATVGKLAENIATGVRSGGRLQKGGQVS